MSDHDKHTEETVYLGRVFVRSVSSGSHIYGLGMGLYEVDLQFAGSPWDPGVFVYLLKEHYTLELHIRREALGDVRPRPKNSDPKTLPPEVHLLPERSDDEDPDSE